jgi:hypothetical protein
VVKNNILRSYALPEKILIFCQKMPVWEQNGLFLKAKYSEIG